MRSKIMSFLNNRHDNWYSFTPGLLVLLLLLFAGAFAQSGTSSVRGTVIDTNGGGVPGGKVTLTNSATNQTRTAMAGADGDFVFNAIPPGTYKVEVEANGFKKGVLINVVAQVDSVVDVTLKLEVGSVSDVVTIISSTEAPINTTDASIGNAFENRRIIELPLNARNIVGLLSLQPGATRNGEVNGGRRDQANVTLDGVDVNEQQTGLDVVSGDAFSSVLRMTPDSVQEFRVTTSNPNATQGRSSGAQVSLVTKLGTNRFHGSLFEFHRNNATTANDYFNNAAGRFAATDPLVLSGLKEAGEEIAPRPKLIRNLFGGAIGGPVVKDQVFFFYNYEKRSDRSETAVTRTVPTATLRTGIVRFPNVGGGTISLMMADIARFYPEAGGVNPVALQALQTAPLPNSNLLGDGLNTASFRFNSPTPSDLSAQIGRVDFNLTSAHSVFVRANYQNDLYTQVRQFPGTPAPALWVHPKGVVAGHTWIIDSALSNNFRYGLTRQSFSQQGDSSANQVSFRDVYDPFRYVRTVSRTTPVHNITNDLSWVKGAHTMQFGGNIRVIRNNRLSTSNSFDFMSTNYFGYFTGGSSLGEPLATLPASERPTAAATVDYFRAISAVLGRLASYSANLNFDKPGNILPAGTPTDRRFATEEYEFYGQDTWKIRPNMTLTYGLRWGVNTPVYESQGFQAKPTTSLSGFFEQRVAAANVGKAFNELISIDLAGKANDRPGFYEMKKDAFAPNVSVAWSPDFGDSFFGRAFGRQGRSVIRGGFRLLYDRVGSALAVNFDLSNALGFSSTSAIAVNTYNATNRLGPLFTGFNQDVRGLPNLTLPGRLTFPRSQPVTGARRIESSLDDSITMPRQYTWNLSYGRELPAGFSLDLSYVGRAGRDLIATRDVMHLNNIRDTQSGQTWYEAAVVLADLRERGLSFSSATGTFNLPIPNIPFFENLFPGNRIRTAAANYLGPKTAPANFTPSQLAALIVARGNGYSFVDFASIQELLNEDSAIGRDLFLHPQYGALAVYSTIGFADYHGLSLSLRQRLGKDVAWDLNYTWSHSFDTGSVLESGTSEGGGFIRNPLNVRGARSSSAFDIRHNINANWVIGLPFGKGKKLFAGSSGAVDAIIGGWSLTGVVRYHTGVPVTPGDTGVWSTNWNLPNPATPIKAIKSSPSALITGSRTARLNGSPNLFSNPDTAYRTFHNSRPGEEVGRNYLRLPGYSVMDFGLYKSFRLSSLEGHRVTFRWEVFNAFNHQPFGGLENLSVAPDSYLSNTARSGFGRFTSSQTPVGESRPGRLMQFALRYDF